MLDSAKMGITVSACSNVRKWHRRHRVIDVLCINERKKALLRVRCGNNARNCADYYLTMHLIVASELLVCFKAVPTEHFAQPMQAFACYRGQRLLHCQRQLSQRCRYAISIIMRQSPSNHDIYPSKSPAEDLQLARLVQYAMDQHASTAVTFVAAGSFVPEYDFAYFCRFRCCRIGWLVDVVCMQSPHRIFQIMQLKCKIHNNLSLPRYAAIVARSRHTSDPH